MTSEHHAERYGVPPPVSVGVLLMKMKTILAIVIAALIFTPFHSRGAEPEPATLPYRAVCQIAQLDFSDTTGFTNQVIRFSVASKNPDVAISDIRMWIDAESGRIPLPIGTNGVLSLPIIPDLLAQNPRIVANQPKGSMELEGFMCVKGTFADSVSRENEGLIRYSALFVTETVKRQIASDLTELKKEHDLDGALSRPTIVHLTAKTNVNLAAVTILSEAGDISVPPVEPGHFRIEYQPKLLKEDPWVRIGTGHEWSIRMKEEGEAEQDESTVPVKAAPSASSTVR